MELTTLIKVKGWFTVAFGALFLFFTAQVMAVLAGDLNSGGTLMAQLFGLTLMAVGFGMVLSGDDVPRGKDALVVVVADSTAVLLLVLATQRGDFSAPGYALAAVYAGSAMLYLYFYFHGLPARVVASPAIEHHE